ncbi:MAG: NAD-dependent epimerase/dehydratase family protein [Lachnospiraceae bacterium]|nr:NAD-dependent epimerase/dehydratase family protein [Lachnospiraceae bacterium]
MDKKTVLLIGGGGTLGTYTAQELLALGHNVDVICREEKASDNERLTFYQANATVEYLEQHFQKKQYDGIVNFLLYSDAGIYPPYHELLIKNTKHLIVVSSYRVYADLEHPITENAPMLLDVSEDEGFLQTEKYALSKAKLERYLRSECAGQNWTIVRPVISFSKYRFDLFTYSRATVIDRTKRGETIPLPIEAKALHAGLDWSGNSGKLIANLLFHENAIGEAYTVSSAQNLTWGEVAEIYSEVMGAKISWVPLEEFQNAADRAKNYILIYDRLFDRLIDNSKILRETKLTAGDFLSIKEGLIIERDKYFGKE